MTMLPGHTCKECSEEEVSPLSGPNDGPPVLCQCMGCGAIRNLHPMGTGDSR